MSRGSETEEVPLTEEVVTIHRRNTLGCDADSGCDYERVVYCSPTIQSSGSQDLKDCDPERPSACSSKRKALARMNSCNDLGHLSRRVFSEAGRQSSDDWEGSSFGFRQMFDNRLEVTPITVASVAACVSAVLQDLMVAGEKRCEEGHLNSAEYDVFCSGGHSKRSQRLWGGWSEDSMHTAGSSMSSSPTISSTAATARLGGEATLFPSLQQITNFVERLCSDAKMEYECIIITLIYVRRLIDTSDGRLCLLRDNWKGIVLSCVVLANKVWDDFHMKNRDYCVVFRGLTLERVNSLELTVFLFLQDCCHISPSVYAATHFEIQAMITTTAIEKAKLNERSKKRSIFSSASKIHPSDPDTSASKNPACVPSPSPRAPSLPVSAARCLCRAVRRFSAAVLGKQRFKGQKVVTEICVE